MEEIHNFKPDTSFDTETGEIKSPEWREIFTLCKEYNIGIAEFQELWDRTIEHCIALKREDIKYGLMAFHNALLDKKQLKLFLEKQIEDNLNYAPPAHEDSQEKTSY